MPLSILFCTSAYPPAPSGGAERQAQLQAEELSRRGHRVTVVCPGWPGTHSGWQNGVRVWRLARIRRRPLERVSYWARLCVWLAANLWRFDLAHVHLADIQADITVLVGRCVGRPVYLKLASSGPIAEVQRMGPLARLTRYFGLRHAAAVQSLSEDIREEVLGVGVAPDRIVSLPNGVDTLRFRPAGPEDKRQLRRTLELPADSVIVLYAGRLERMKGTDDLLIAWKARPHANTDATLVLLGSRKSQPQYRPSASGAIQIRGWSARVEEYFRAADVFVLPSRAEGMSNALLEAMASGLAVVATRVGAAQAMIDDGANGLLVDTASPAQLSNALARLIADPAHRCALGRNARETTLRHFSISRVVDRLEKEYAELVARA